MIKFFGKKSSPKLHEGQAMKQIYSDVIEYRGSHYDFGYWQGEKIRASLIVTNREKQWRFRKPKFSVDIEEARKAYNTYGPGLWEELIGLSDGLKMPLDQVLRDFGGYRVPSPRGGCSTIVTNEYIVRNYDYHPKTYEGRYVFYQPTDQGYATIGPSQRIVGRMDGMNEQGLSMAYNFMHRKKPGKGFICHAIGRIVLENAKDVPEAVQLIKEIPHRHSFSYMLADKQGKQITVEASPRKIVTRETPLCTNHFLLLTEENRRFVAESEGRLQAMEQFWHQDLTIEQAYGLLNDPKKGVFVEDYQSWAGTIHTTAYLPKNLEAWIALGGNQQPIKFRFADWLRGEKLSVKRIHGEVNTDQGFAHMDNIRR